MTTQVSDGTLESISRKVEGGERVERDEAEWLMSACPIHDLGILADSARDRKVGNHAFYSANLNITHTNVCVNRCAFCAFSRDKTDGDSYSLSLDEIAEKIDSPFIKEAHIVGGLHPDLPLHFYEEILRLIKSRRPDMTAQGYTAVEIDHFSKIAQIPVVEVLRRLHDAGLDTLPGGGAEVFSPRVRAALCPDKLDGAGWLSIMETAHRLGIKTNATMLYGHIETPAERVDHLLALRDLQDKTGGFMAFVPLAFHPENTNMEGSVRRSPGIIDLRVIAASRIILDNFAHVKALWMYLGLKLTEIALHYGADDVGGTCIEEEIVHSAGANAPMGVSASGLERIIRNAGRIPIVSDSRYGFA